MIIEMETVATLRRAMLDHSVEVPDTSTFRKLMDSMFPYMEILKEKQMERAKEIMKEDLESLLVVTPMGGPKRRRPKKR